MNRNVTECAAMKIDASGSVKQRVASRLRYHSSRLVSRYVSPQWLEIPIGFRALSITFDDFPASAARAGAEALADFEGKATFYAASGMLAHSDTGAPSAAEHAMASFADVRRLHALGHEIACHTREHLDCARAADETIVASIGANRAALAPTIGNTPLTSFAFPYGQLRPSNKTQLARHFDSLRTIYPGVHQTRVDLHQLRANKLYSRGPWLQHALRLLNKVSTQGGWLVLYTHDVHNAPSDFGVSPTDLRAFLEAAERHRMPSRTVASVTSALRAAAVQQPAG
jgi:peptidoglycan/xylan/chitin deacetylase (PgdA/CDA1 family)